MNADKLLDAIGMVDDELLAQEQRPAKSGMQRKTLALLTAAVLITLTVGMAMATTIEGIPDQWRIWEGMFRIFRLDTHETPPGAATEAAKDADPELPQATTAPALTDPTEPEDLQQLDVINIEDAVTVQYFKTENHVQPCDGGFYTYSNVGEFRLPPDAAFWEVRGDGVVNVGANHVDMQVQQADITLDITFDYAVLGGSLAIRVWPKNLHLDPYAYGWNAEPVGDRTDVVLLHLPRTTGNALTNDYVLLDLKTMEMTDILKDIPHEDLIIDYAWFTQDLRYALLHGTQILETGEYYRWTSWLCDLENNTIVALKELLGVSGEEAHFLTNDTFVYYEPLENGNCNVMKYDIIAAQSSVILENVAATSEKPEYFVKVRSINGNNYSRYLLHYEEDGTADIVDMLTAERTLLGDLYMKGWKVIQSPGGTRIMLARRKEADADRFYNVFTGIGMLNPTTGTMLMLERTPSAFSEDIMYWAGEETIVIQTKNTEGGWYVYTYAFKN